MKTFNFNRFLNVARWDLTVNRHFYTRTLLLLMGVILVPVVYKYLMVLGDFHPFNAAAVGAQMAAEVDLSGMTMYFSAVFMVMMISMLCHTFHNLVTKQGRICELTLPASNLERFSWHVLFSVLGTVIAFFMVVLLADLTHVVLGAAVLGQTSFQSMTLATLCTLIAPIKVLPVQAVGELVMPVIFLTIMSASYISTFVLGSAWKYRHTLAVTLLYHFAFQLVMLLLSGYFVSLLGNTLPTILDELSHVKYLGGALLVGFALAVFAGIWWLTYRLYCRAQVSSRRNP